MTLCIMPWISLNLIGGTKRNKTCCWQNYHIDPEKYDSMDKIWNSNGAQALRKLMLKGQWDNELCPISCPLRGNSTVSRLKEYFNHISTTTSNSTILDNIAKAITNIEDQKAVLDSKPIFLEIYKPHKCNVDCVMCWEKYYESMELGVNPQILSDFNEYVDCCKEISFLGGKPLITWLDEIRNILYYYPDKDLFLNTNGILLEKIDFELFIDRFSKIVISLNAASKEVHEKINRGSSWEKVISQIKHIVSLKKKKGLLRPEIVINMVVANINYKQMREFINLAQKLGCYANFELCWIGGYARGDMIFDLPKGTARQDMISILDELISAYSEHSFGLGRIRKGIINAIS